MLKPFFTILFLLCGTLHAAKNDSFIYICWDMHRFSRNHADYLRDARYLADIGFTHSLRSAAIPHVLSEKGGKDYHDFFDAFSKQGIVAGLKFGWDLKAMEKHFGGVDAMMQNGTLMMKKKKGFTLHFNPMHPDIIDYFSKQFVQVIDQLVKNDPNKSLGMFLIGSEHVWSLGKKPEKMPKAAQDAIFKAAVEDGILKSGERDFKKIAGWWAWPKTKGREYRLKKSIYDPIRAKVPDVRFFIDPQWAMKFTSDEDLGGTWTYLGKGFVKNVACRINRLRALSWPNPVTHSTQLIKGAHRDNVLMANLMSLCVGADSLYHWGVHKIEPGRLSQPYYRLKHRYYANKGFPALALKGGERHRASISDWDAFTKKLDETKDLKWAKSIWKNLGMDSLDPELVENSIRPDIIKAINISIEEENLFDIKTLSNLKLSKRAKSLLERRKQGTMLVGNHKELNRLALEAYFGHSMHKSPEPNIVHQTESLTSKREKAEPSLRSTGRLLKLRGKLFKSWKPLSPRIAMLSGVYGAADVHMGMLVGHLPYDVIRYSYHREAIIPQAKYIFCQSGTVAANHYDLIRQAVEGGAKFFIPDNFKVPDNKSPIKGAIKYEAKAYGKKVRVGKSMKFKGSQEQLDTLVQANAKKLRKLLHGAGYKPYFDSENFGIIMRDYEYRGVKFLFVVNEKRQKGFFHLGAPNSVEIIIHDKDAKLKVIDIDTGSILATQKHSEGRVFKDTIPSAWYRIYAVLKPGQNLPDLPEVPAAEKISDIKTKAIKEGITLSWNIDVKDWCGSEVQFLHVYRKQGSGKEVLHKTIYARRIEGAGGLRSSFIDSDVKKGTKYTYRLQCVSPLNAVGPISQPSTSKAI